MLSDLLLFEITFDLFLADEEHVESCQKRKEISTWKHRHWKDCFLSEQSLLIQFYLTTKKWLNLKKECCQYLQARLLKEYIIYLRLQGKSLSLLSTVFFSRFQKVRMITGYSIL